MRWRRSRRSRAWRATASRRQRVSPRRSHCSTAAGAARRRRILAKMVRATSASRLGTSCRLRSRLRLRSRILDATQMRHERKLSYSRSDKQRIIYPLAMIKLNGVRSVGRNGGEISQYLSQGLANPHPQSIVNGTIGDLEVARPTVIRPPLNVPNLPPKNPDNPFSWSANGIAKSPAKIGRALLAGHTIEGRRAAVRPKPAIGAAPASGR